MNCHEILIIVLKRIKVAVGVFFAIGILSAPASQAQTFEVEFDSTSYLQVEPAEGWNFHSPRYLYLQPGESDRPLVLLAQHKGGMNQITARFQVYAMRDPAASVDVSVDVSHAGRHSPDPTLDQFPIRVAVYDEVTGDPLPDAHVYIWVGARPEHARLRGSGLFEFMAPAYDTLKSIAQRYQIPWEGFPLEVHCEGYQSVYRRKIGVTLPWPWASIQTPGIRIPFRRSFICLI